jgi:hypothetical protein
LTEASAFPNVTQAKIWLQTQSATTLNPVQTKAKQLKEDMDTALQGLNDASKMLADNSSREIEKRNMKVYNRARALNKIALTFLERLKKMDSPLTISYDNLNLYVSDIQKVLTVTDVDIKNWFPRISPFFIMDRRKFMTFFERTKLTYNSLNNFVSKEYVKTKTLEDAMNLLNESEVQERQLAQLNQDKEAIKTELQPILNEISALEQKIAKLKTEGPVDKLNQINTEIETLNSELKNVLRHMQKPFIKMQALASFGGGAGISPDELNKLNHYLDGPFEAISTEPQGYPVLKGILRKLTGLIQEDKLKLKDEKARKAEQSIEEILQSDLLAQMQARAIELAKCRQELSCSALMDEIKRDLAASQIQLDLLKARKNSVEGHLSVKEQAYGETQEKITKNKRTVEKNVSESLGKKIQIQ